MAYNLLPAESYLSGLYSWSRERAVTVVPSYRYGVDHAMPDGRSNFVVAAQLRRREAMRRATYYNAPTPYWAHYAWENPSIGGPASENVLSWGAGAQTHRWANTSADAAVFNLARERFVDKLRKTAEMGEFLAEIRKTASSIKSMLGPATEFFLALAQIRKGHVKPLASLILKTDPSGRDTHWRRRERWRQRRKMLRDLQRESKTSVIKNSDARIASAWLELQYGLGPAVHTIYDFADALNSGFPVGSVSGRARAQVQLDPYPAVLSKGYNTHGQRRVKVHVQAEVSLTHAVSGTLEQFGVFNLPSLAWELLPFSLVVDWFANVGQYIRSFSDTAGFTFTNPFVSTKREATVFYRYYDMNWSLTYQSVHRGTSLQRTLGFPSVRLTPGSGLRSLIRAANAVALVASIGHSVLNQRPINLRH